MWRCTRPDSWSSLALLVIINSQQTYLPFSSLTALLSPADTLRLASILIDDIRAIKDFNIKGCIECQFSNGESGSNLPAEPWAGC